MKLIQKPDHYKPWMDKLKNPMPELQNKILYESAIVFRIKPKFLFKKRRKEKYAHARFVAMLLLYQICGLKKTHIANIIFNKDHSTVVHGINLICDLITTDEQYRVKVNEIRDKFLSGKEIKVKPPTSIKQKAA